MDRKTVLYDTHVSLGARMVPFGGFIMPVQYTDILKEHMAVRTAVGLFDVSHMGEVTLKGPDALKNLNEILTNDYTNMKDGRCRYSPMCNAGGGVVDDLIVYMIADNDYFIVVNSPTRTMDFDWIRDHLTGDVEFKDIGDSVAQIAVQGPKSALLLEKLTAAENLPPKYYTFYKDIDVGGVKCIISQTGYTGEYGFELYCPSEDAVKLWDELMDAGKEFGVLPCGLGARDTLRMEAAMPLYGHEMDDTISPLETGLDFAVKMNKESFIGKDALVAKGEPTITRVGLKVTGKGLVREKTELFAADGLTAGRTTSGTYLPYLKGAYAMALVDKKYAAVGTVFDALTRGRHISVEVVPLPFYKADKSHIEK